MGLVSIPNPCRHIASWVRVDCQLIKGRQINGRIELAGNMKVIGKQEAIIFSEAQSVTQV